MNIRLKRAYDPAGPDDGYRVLVDYWWPRGVTEAEAHLDAWERDLAPTAALRQWFHHEPELFDGFRQRYAEELAAHQPLLEQLRSRAQQETVTLVFGARDRDHNNAVVVAEVLEGDHRKL